MRQISVKQISEAISLLCEKANYTLTEDVQKSIKRFKNNESDEGARDVLETIEKNILLAEEENIPLCQDTGMACVFLEIGQEVSLTGGNLYDAINNGVAEGYKRGYLRKSIVKDPLNRINTGDNTPAAIYTEIVSGDKIKITFAAKGFGSENMSKIAMLAPSDGLQGIKQFIIETIKSADANPCPPIVVGVGIGGNFDKCALLAKKALLLPIDEHNEAPYYRDLEIELLKEINKLGIGPQGFGGDTTAIGLRILVAPTHIAGMPVAVNINCHVARHQEVII